MVSCGSINLPEFRASARLTLVSAQSFEESHANVIVRDTSTTVG
jgi:IMP dehydrogenase